MLSKVNRAVTLIRRVIRSVVVIYLLVCAGMYLLQDYLIFVRQELVIANTKGYEKNKIEISSGGEKLRGWFLQNAKADNELTVIYYGGNAEEVSWMLASAQQINARNLLLLNYRGYGESSGKPSEDAFYRDAQAAIDYLEKERGISKSSMILIGRSIGSGVATKMAADNTVAGLILVTPFDSLANTAQQMYPFFPAIILVKHRFDSLARAGKIAEKTLVLIAENDELVMPQQSLILAKAIAGETTVVTLDGVNHSDISLHRHFWQVVNGFIYTVAKKRGEEKL